MRVPRGHSRPTTTPSDSQTHRRAGPDGEPVEIFLGLAIMPTGVLYTHRCTGILGLGVDQSRSQQLMVLRELALRTGLEGDLGVSMTESQHPLVHLGVGSGGVACVRPQNLQVH